VKQNHKKAPDRAIPINVIEALVETPLDLLFNCLISDLERENV
jgi:hypothetical protein